MCKTCFGTISIAAADILHCQLSTVLKLMGEFTNPAHHCVLAQHINRIGHQIADQAYSS